MTYWGSAPRREGEGIRKQETGEQPAQAAPLESPGTCIRPLSLSCLEDLGAGIPKQPAVPLVIGKGGHKPPRAFGLSLLAGEG